MALTRAERERRHKAALWQLRRAWTSGAHVRLAVQNGRGRRTVTGRVVAVAVSGAYVHIADGVAPDCTLGEALGPLHVPLDTVRAVAVMHRRRFVQVVP